MEQQGTARNSKEQPSNFIKKYKFYRKNIKIQKNKREFYIQCYGENMENFENSFLLLIGECRQDKKIKIKKIKIMFYIQCYEIKK